MRRPWLAALAAVLLGLTLGLTAAANTTILRLVHTGIGSAQTFVDEVLLITNTTNATAGTEIQFSPIVGWQSNVWDEVGLVNVPLRFGVLTKPQIDASHVISNYWSVMSSVNGGAYSEAFTVRQDGVLGTYGYLHPITTDRDTVGTSADHYLGLHVYGFIVADGTNQPLTTGGNPAASDGSISNLFGSNGAITNPKVRIAAFSTDLSTGNIKAAVMGDGTVVAPLQAAAAAAPSISSGSTIAPVVSPTTVTGTSTISTITVPANMASGCIDLISKDGYVTTTGGNISVAITVASKHVGHFCYDGTTWSPN